MTDEEKRAAIEALVDAEPHIDDCPAPEFLARVRSMGDRIRTILDDVPSVVWTTDPHRVVGITRDAEIVITPDGPREPPGHRILITGLVEDPEWADVYVLCDLASAQRRALALYVALRGVT